MATTKEDVYEGVYYEGKDAYEEGVPRWCTTYEGKLKQIWQSGWDAAEKKDRRKKNVA